VQVIDTSFRIQKARKGKALPGVTKLTMQDLQDPESLAVYLATVYGLPEEDCLVVLQECAPQLPSPRSSTMAHRASYTYAQLPVYKYQTFDCRTLTFSDHPVIPPRPAKMRFFGEGADTDDPSKNIEAPDDPLADTETSEPLLDIIDPSPGASGDGRSTVDLRR
jgi:hypothetical protein